MPGVPLAALATHPPLRLPVQGLCSRFGRELGLAILPPLHHHRCWVLQFVRVHLPLVLPVRGRSISELPSAAPECLAEALQREPPVSAAVLPVQARPHLTTLQTTWTLAALGREANICPFKRTMRCLFRLPPHIFEKHGWRLQFVLLPCLEHASFWISLANCKYRSDRLCANHYLQAQSGSVSRMRKAVATALSASSGARARRTAAW